MSTETLVEEIHSVVLETDELESHEEPNACGSFEILSQSSFR